MDIYSVVSLDAIDCLKFCTTRGISQLVVSPTIDDGSLDIRTLESASCDRNNGAAAVITEVSRKTVDNSRFFIWQMVLLRLLGAKISKIN